MVGVETGGRLNYEAKELLSQLAAAKARSAPRLLQPSMTRVWRARWTCMASVAAQDALAATLVNDGLALLDGKEGTEPRAIDAWVDEGS